MGGGHRSDYEIWSGGRWGVSCLPFHRGCYQTRTWWQIKIRPDKWGGPLQEEGDTYPAEVAILSTKQNGFHVLTLTFDPSRGWQWFQLEHFHFMICPLMATCHIVEQWVDSKLRTRETGTLKNMKPVVLQIKKDSRTSINTNGSKISGKVVIWSNKYNLEHSVLKKSFGFQWCSVHWLQM